MTVALFAGAFAGLGVLIVFRGLFPAAVPLQVALARVNRRERDDGASSELLDRVGAGLIPLTESLGLSLTRLRADLDITGRTLGRHLGEKLLLGIFGVCLVPITTVVMALGGVHLPLGVPLWIALILGVVLFFAPDIGIRAEAVQKRNEFRHGLGSFLDLVVIGLAGGAGVESALEEAANAGTGFAAQRLRHAMTAARLRAETPWVALGRLGEELKISELIELSACVGLAGAEGARVRQSLAAKATSLRTHQLAEAETEAQSSTERMSLPVVVLFLGFLIFIGFPAISRVMVSL